MERLVGRGQRSAQPPKNKVADRGSGGPKKPTLTKNEHQKWSVPSFGFNVLATKIWFENKVNTSLDSSDNTNNKRSMKDESVPFLVQCVGDENLV